MASKVKTLDESIKEAKQLAAMYKDLIANGKRREQIIADEIATYQERMDFLRKARENAPASLKRALDGVRRLEAQRNANLASGYQGPSKATLQRKSDRVDTLRDRLRNLAAELRASGLDPEALLRKGSDDE